MNVVAAVLHEQSQCVELCNCCMVKSQSRAVIISPVPKQTRRLSWVWTWVFRLCVQHGSSKPVNCYTHTHYDLLL